MIQAVLFPIDDKYKLSSTRLNILKHLNLQPLKKVHKTQHYYRYRIIEPDKFTRFHTIKKNDILFVIGS